MSAHRPILIFGPTASGKSVLALRLARVLNGVVINADSMQVYRELRVLTARPSAEEERSAPHALYGFVAGAETYSAGRYAADAARAIAEARAKGLRPIFVGGTGLYFKTLLEGLSPIPPVAEEVREAWRERALAAAPGELYAELARRDPEMARRLAPGDTQRILRALEVLQSTGLSLALWQQRPREPVLTQEASRIVLVPDREELVRRIDRRFTAMMEAGALEEVRGLAALKLDPELPAMTAHGVPPLLRHLSGEMTLDEAVTASQAETRQYAKRQMTWARGNMISWRQVYKQQMECSDNEIISFIDT